MEIAEIIQNIISNLGFPIFISIYLIYYMNETQKKMMETIASLNESIVILAEKIENLERKGDN